MDGWTSGPDPQWGAPPAGAPQERRLSALTLGDVLDGMFRLLITHWRVYLIALGVIVIPTNIIAGWLVSETMGGFGSFVDMMRNPVATPAATAQPSPAVGVGAILVQVIQTLVVTPIVWGLGTHIAVEAYQGMQPSVGGVWQSTMRRFWALLGVLLLIWLIAFGAVLVLGVGMATAIAVSQSPAVAFVLVIAVLAVVIWLTVKLSLAIPALVAEDVGPGTAIGRSWSLVKGKFWPLLGRWIVVVIILIVLSIVGAGALALLGAVAGPAGPFIGGIAGWIIVSMLSTPLLLNAATLQYYDSRIRGEAYDLDLMTRDVGAAPPVGPAAGPPFG